LLIQSIQETIEIKQGLNIDQLKKKFEDIYDVTTGPTGKKYNVHQINLMYYQLLPQISLREISGSLNSDYQGYKTQLETLVISKLEDLEKNGVFKVVHE